MFTEQTQATVSELHKSQFLRLWDVFVLAPVLMYSSMQVKEKWLRRFLVTGGIAIAVYNGRNYLINRNLLK